jgi:hypothetical protein
MASKISKRGHSAPGNVRMARFEVLRKLLSGLSNHRQTVSERVVGF